MTITEIITAKQTAFRCGYADGYYARPQRAFVFDASVWADYQQGRTAGHHDHMTGVEYGQ
jgi:hypothetical protein